VFSKTISLPLLPVLLLAFHSTVEAQPYTIDWYTIDGGSGASVGGTYTLSGTTGQPDAGTSSGGSYTLEGGFWPGIVVVASTGTPTLFIQRVGLNSISISWSPAPAGFILEQTDNLSSPSWSPAPSGNPEAVQVAGTSTFYRLRKP
jgi:hypothetical protein